MLNLFHTSKSLITIHIINWFFHRNKSLAKKRQMEKDDPTMKIKKRVKVRSCDDEINELFSLVLN